MKILVVDDSKSVQLFVKSCLEGTPYEFKAVDNGSLAVEELKNNNDYSLILLDWEMPVMTGPETLRELAKQKYKTPVVMMTTRNSPEDIMCMLNLGVKDYIMKPFTKDIILGKLEMFCPSKLENAG